MVKLSPAQKIGLIYYAYISNKAFSKPKFNHDPRTIQALLDKNLIARFNDGLPGVTFRITDDGMKLALSLPESDKSNW
jgi:hypothetical protein